MSQEIISNITAHCKGTGSNIQQINEIPVYFCLSSILIIARLCFKAQMMRVDGLNTHKKILLF